MSVAVVGRPGTGGAVVRVAIVGLGAIGQEVLKAVQARPGLRLVSVADPAFVGRDAGEVAGVGACGVTVVGERRRSVRGRAGRRAGADRVQRRRRGCQSSTRPPRAAST